MIKELITKCSLLYSKSLEVARLKVSLRSHVVGVVAPSEELACPRVLERTCEGA